MVRHKVVTGKLNITAPVSLYSSWGKLLTLKNSSQKLESRTGSCLKMASKETLKEKNLLNPVSLGNGCFAYICQHFVPKSFRPLQTFASELSRIFHRNKTYFPVGFVL